MAVREKVGFCTLCRSRCGTVNHVEDGRLVAVHPNPAHPTGQAICAKGRAAPEIVHSARRLATPLRRTAPKGAADPLFVPIGWTEALDAIADRLDAIRRENGPEAVAFAVTSGSSSSLSDGIDWIQRFIRGFGSPNTCYSTEICNWHKDHAHAFTFGCGIPTPDYRNADLILLWGHNPATSWLAQAEAIGAARARGARLIVIDPRGAGLAAGADLWLRVRPGTDAALAMALARLMIRNGTIDTDFVARFSNGPLLVRDDTGRFLRGRDLGWRDAPDAYAMASDAGLTPVRPGEAGRLAREPITAGGPHGPVACRTAFQRFAEAVEPYDPATAARLTGVPAEAIEAAAAMLGRAGAIAYYCWTGVGQHANAVQTDRAIATLTALTGAFDRRGGNVRLPTQPVPALHAVTMIPPEIRAKALGLAERPLGPATDGWITPTALYDAVLDGTPYRVRALVGFGSNLLVSHPGEARGRRALEALEFQVHCDLFPNPTSATADILLPVSSAWENEGLRIGFDVSLEGQELVQLRQPIVPPVADGRSDTWIVFQLARRLGMGDLFFDGDVEAGLGHLLAPLGLDLATLRAHPEGIRRPLDLRYEKYRDTGFATQTGRVELYSELFLRHGQPPLPTFTASDAEPDDAYPLVLFSANTAPFCHSQHRGIASLRRRRPAPLVALNPEAAARRGIREGDRVAVRTREGRIELVATVDDTLAPDTAAADYGWWQGAPDLGLPDHRPAGDAPGANFNQLVGERLRDPVSGALPLRSTACEVDLVHAARADDWLTLCVVARRDAAEGVVALELAAADGGVLPGFAAGQFVTLDLDGQARSYSLTGPASPAPRRYRLGIGRVEGGSVSPLLHAGLTVGDRVRARAPAGHFLIPARNAFPIVLIAAGIGITPFLSALEGLTGAPGEPEVILHYACRDAARRPFLDRIQEIAARCATLRVVAHLSRPAPGDACDHAGRFRAETLPEALIRRRPRFYLCAPARMMDEVTEDLRARGVPAFEIFRERFVSPRPLPAGPLAPRSVTYARSGRSLAWEPASGSLLALAEAAGLRPPSGCRVGLCESCAVRVLEGEVAHLGPVPDLDPGTCLTCLAVPHSDVVLDA
ncbi:molybdopterin-dependent oxidoreductase [Methylobacterium sp. JK268]